MRINEQYMAINNLIQDYCDRNNIVLIDIYLVGSRVNGTWNAKSDFDSIVVIDITEDVNKIKIIREEINDVIEHINKNNFYHFKLFNKKELDSASVYDGFRIYEFLTNKISSLNNYQIHLNPVLNQDSFINSLLIQEVYEHYTSKFNSKSHKRMIKRFERNNEILKINNIRPYFNEYCTQQFCIHTLFAQFLNTKTNHLSMVEFLKNYYLHFPHEYINKAAFYNNIEQNSVYASI